MEIARAKFPQGDLGESGDYARSHKNIGAGKRSRTSDLLITNQLLYQLSYAGPAVFQKTDWHST